MKKVTLILVAAAMVAAFGCGGGGGSRSAADLPSFLDQFIPEGYTLLDTISGNLNLDQYQDMIVVLKKIGEEETSNVVDNPEKRPLLILLGQADNTFKLAARNDNAVYCVNCGGMMGDPYVRVVVNDGNFSIEHYGGSAWRWARNITFQYSPEDENWYLYQDVDETFHASEHEDVTSKIRTTKDFGKIPFEEFDIYEEYEDTLSAENEQRLLDCTGIEALKTDKKENYIRGILEIKYFAIQKKALPLPNDI